MPLLPGEFIPPTKARASMPLSKAQGSLRSAHPVIWPGFRSHWAPAHHPLLASGNLPTAHRCRLGASSVGTSRASPRLWCSAPRPPHGPASAPSIPQGARLLALPSTPEWGHHLQGKTKLIRQLTLSVPVLPMSKSAGSIYFVQLSRSFWQNEKSWHCSYTNDSIMAGCRNSENGLWSFENPFASLRPLRN